jgi:hypothetical protein
MPQSQSEGAKSATSPTSNFASSIVVLALALAEALVLVEASVPPSEAALAFELEPPFDSLVGPALVLADALALFMVVSPAVSLPVISLLSPHAASSEAVKSDAASRPVRPLSSRAEARCLADRIASLRMSCVIAGSSHSRDV